MKKVNMESAIKRYNSIMICIGYEHVTIGTDYSENTNGWNLRDMVSECDYTLSTYYQDGHCNGDMRYGNEENKKLWRSETGKLRRFINTYSPFISDMKCVSGHCSKYDNND